jgi:hypothetical protein
MSASRCAGAFSSLHARPAGERRSAPWRARLVAACEHQPVRWFRRKKAKLQRRRRVLSHQTPPIEGDLPGDVSAEVMASAKREYAAAVRGLGEQLRGKIVTDSAGGHAGYVLRFTHGSWVAAWLDPASARMEFRTGDDEPPGDVLAHLMAVGVADVRRRSTWTCPMPGKPTTSLSKPGLPTERK